MPTKVRTLDSLPPVYCLLTSIYLIIAMRYKKLELNRELALSADELLGPVAPTLVNLTVC
jgi:hypothetical protein